MRKLFCFLLVYLFGISKITAKADDSYIIRRAFIDVIGIVPTTPEIEWYCVYNINGYSLAIDWLLHHNNCYWIIPIEYSRILLLSSEYRNLPKTKISKQQVFKNLLYVSGTNLPVTQENVKNASIRFVSQARACGDGDTEIIDYMCDALMARSSNMEEANKLTKILRLSKKSEDDAWLDVLSEILEFDDVNCK